MLSRSGPLFVRTDGAPVQSSCKLGLRENTPPPPPLPPPPLSPTPTTTFTATANISTSTTTNVGGGESNFDFIPPASLSLPDFFFYFHKPNCVKFHLDLKSFTKKNLTLPLDDAASPFSFFSWPNICYIDLSIYQSEVCNFTVSFSLTSKKFSRFPSTLSVVQIFLFLFFIFTNI